MKDKSRSWSMCFLLDPFVVPITCCIECTVLKASLQINIHHSIFITVSNVKWIIRICCSSRNIDTSISIHRKNYYADVGVWVYVGLHSKSIFIVGKRMLSLLIAHSIASWKSWSFEIMCKYLCWPLCTFWQTQLFWSTTNIMINLIINILS